MKIAICNSQNWFQISDEVSKKNKILHIRKKSDLTLSLLRKFQPDLIFFPHWNWIVEKEIFNEFKCIVFHTAPLPYGRGGSPIQNLIQRGHTASPVCAIAMSDGIDSGPIYDQEEISLDGSLSEIFKRLGCAVNEMMRRLIQHLPEPIEQAGEAIIFKRLGHKDNEISFDLDFEEFYNAVRMLDDSSYPSAYLKMENLVIEFSEIDRSCNELFCRVRISSKDTFE